MFDIIGHIYKNSFLLHIKDLINLQSNIQCNYYTQGLQLEFLLLFFCDTSPSYSVIIATENSDGSYILRFVSSSAAKLRVI